MLDCLHIENIAVIERADIRFGAGFNVLTGETGAGKSIVIDAINAILGQRINRELVRTGADAARVTALFSHLSSWATNQLCELGFAPDEEGNLLISRIISAEGKGVCHVNGSPATAALLREIGKALIDLHGQHENQALLSPDRHLAYLDRFGNTQEALTHYQAVYRQWRQACRERQAADLDETEKERRLDLLRYQINEIEETDLKPGEEEELTARRTLYRHSEKVSKLLMEAKSLLSGGENENGAVSMTEKAVCNLNSAAQYMEQAASLATQLQEALYTVQETANDLSSLTDLLEFNPHELDKTENRLEQIHRLLAKYGPDETAVLNYLENIREEQHAIALSDERLRKLTEQETTLQKQTEEASRRLTEQRREAAKVFASRVQEELAFLDMPNVSLQIVQESVAPGTNGADKVEFLISANVGEPPKPISRIASGGELSRIMLAIKSVLADADEIDTLIFDEIDTGISGRAAQKVGIRLRQTAQSGDAGRCRQILCVTHLAQIAAQADQHFLISKSVHDGRTFTDITLLDEDGCVDELARIIGGTVTAATIDAAREMRHNAEYTA